MHKTIGSTTSNSNVTDGEWGKRDGERGKREGEGGGRKRERERESACASA